MKITETMLLDGYVGKTNGGDNISKINGQMIIWNYRTGDNGDGYNSVCSRGRASEISLEYDRVGKIDLDDETEEHANVGRIHSDEQKLWGDEV